MAPTFNRMVGRVPAHSRDINLRLLAVLVHLVDVLGGRVTGMRHMAGGSPQAFHAAACTEPALSFWTARHKNGGYEISGSPHWSGPGLYGGPSKAVAVPSAILHAVDAALPSGSTPEERAAMGIPEGLVRYSVGIEDAGDLIADLGQAFTAA